MSCQKINLLESVSSWTEEDNLSQILRLNDHKVKFNVILAPGPGTYRLPSDFGQYDELLRPLNMSTTELVKTTTGRTSATSHNKREWLTKKKVGKVVEFSYIYFLLMENVEFSQSLDLIFLL